MTKEQLTAVRKWANDKLSSGEEPPWAWYQYMKLKETLDAILAGMDAITTESSQQLAERPGMHLRLVDSTRRQDSVRCHPLVVPVQLPM